MEIVRRGAAGTMESSDIQVHLEPAPEGGITVHLKSAVEKQYGDHIRQLIRETLSGLGITGAVVRAVDKGALDCTIRARVKTAAERALASEAEPGGGLLS